MECPICSGTTGIVINTHAGGYAKDVMECTKCETLWTTDGRKVTILNKKAA